MPRAGNIVGGKYRLVDTIGEGSMGSVWMAVHESLDRPFAVKFLKDFHNDAARLEDRFAAEARLSASVRHPFVVSIVDQGRTDEGTPYIVMEYLDGVSLGTRLRVGPNLTVAELIRIVHQALAGLAAVHRAGILHRDLKPDNVMLCRGYPASGPVVAKLVDFGISRPLLPARDSDAGRKRLTSPGTAVGTPWYMAPELVQALPSVDLRSDLYSMGVIIYEALTGQVPFFHDDLQIVLLMVGAGRAAPVSAQRPDLPAALSDLVARAMAIDPAARFASADEFAAALREVARLVPEGCICRTSDDSRPRTVTSLPGSQPSASNPFGSVITKVRLGDQPAPEATRLIARRWPARVWTTRPRLVGSGILALAGGVLWLTWSRLAWAPGSGRPPQGPASARVIAAPPPPRAAAASFLATQRTPPKATTLTSTAASGASTEPQKRRTPPSPHRAPALFRQPGF